MNKFVIFENSVTKDKDMKELTVGKIMRSLRRFEDFASDLSQSDMNTFDDRLKLLMDYCRTDQVFSIIHNQLINVPNVDFDLWYNDVVSTARNRNGIGLLKFPTNLDERLSLMYRLLVKVNNGDIDFTNFTITFFVTVDKRFDSFIQAFNEAVVDPLARELSYRIEELNEEMPEDNKETFPLANIQIIHNATNVIQQSASGDYIQQSANIEVNRELKQLFNDLRTELQKTIKDKEKLVEVMQIVESSEELSKKGSGSLTSVKTLLSSLSTLGNVGSIISAILAALAAIG